MSKVRPPGAQAFQMAPLCIFLAFCLMDIRVDILYKEYYVGVDVSCLIFFPSFTMLGRLRCPLSWRPSWHAGKVPGQRLQRCVSGCCFTFFLEAMRALGRRAWPRGIQEGPTRGRFINIFQPWALVGEDRKQACSGISRNITICHNFYNNPKKEQ